MAVNGINALNPLFSSPNIIKNDKTEESAQSFGDYLKDALNRVNDMQLDADNAAEDFAAGKTDNIHQVMIAAEKADIALQFTMQIRNKILDAYNEIMRMQI